MICKLFRAFGSILAAVKRGFLEFVSECAAALIAAKNAAKTSTSEKTISAQMGEHVGCAVCELGKDLTKRAVKIFLSSLLAYVGGRFFGRFLPVHAGWHHAG